MLDEKDRKYEFTERGLIRKRGKGRRHANPHKLCMCRMCKHLGGKKRSSRKVQCKELARRNNRSIRKFGVVKPIGYTD